MYQHPSDWHNNTGVIRDAHARGMGIILMRVSRRCGSLTSGVFQRLMAEAFPEIDVLDVGRLLLNYVLSDTYVDVALVGVRKPRFAELNNEISDDVASRIDLADLHDRYVR
jgi:predicted aldo/keto reductase-like oxidoreductase